MRLAAPVALFARGSHSQSVPRNGDPSRKNWTTAIAQVIGPAESPATGRNVSPTIGLTGVADDVGARAML